MRNLKRALSLLLASVMVLGLMIVGTSAADYKDQAKISDEYVEAVAVMKALKVIEGANGYLYPQDGFTREQAAKIICYMLLGPTNADKLGTNQSIFKDVAANRWSAGYIAYCVQMGILEGAGDNMFYPDGRLTGSAFGKMLLVALGYDAKQEGYTGAEWEINVATDMIDAGIDVDGTVLSGDVTREEAAQMAFQTLTATTVKYERSGIQIGDVIIPGSSAEPKDGAKYENYKEKESKNDDYLQFCEQYFPSLKLSEDKDAMGRPASKWTYKDETVVVADDVDTSAVINVDDTTVSEVLVDNYKKAESSEIKAVYINGDPKKDATLGDITLKAGDVVEFFVETKKDEKGATSTEYTICVTQYTIGTLTDDPVTRTKDDVDQVRLFGIPIGYTDVKKVVGYEGLAKDDVVYYYQDNDKVFHFAVADSFDGTLSRISNDKYTIEGEEYRINGNASEISGLKPADFDNEYTFYTDDNGFIIKSVPAGEEKTSDYIVLEQVSYVTGSGKLDDSKYVEGRIIHMDGTAEVVKIAAVKDKSNTEIKMTDGDKISTTFESDTVGKKFFTYSEGSSGYTLTEVETKELTPINGEAIKNGKVEISGTTSSVSVNNSTVFVVNNSKDGNAHKYTVYTGRNNVPTIEMNGTESVIYLVNKSGVATYVFVLKYKSTNAGVTGDTVFVLSGTPKSTVTNKDGEFATYEAIINGEEYGEITVDKGEVSTIDPGKLYIPTYEDDVITAMDESTTVVSKKTGYTMSDGTLIVDTAEATSDSYSCDSSVPVFIVTTEDGEVVEVTEGTAAELTNDPNDSIYVVVADDAVSYVVIFEVDPED